jgi:hypothetical protein
MDTSDHDWLEGRGPRLYLIAMIDDATSRLWGRFVESDSTAENLLTLRGWLERQGRPLALYTDKNTIFQAPRWAELIDRYGPPAPTHFAAALEELRTEWIPAQSPQAKGRVERLFETLQDRLVKEMRIAGIDSAEQADRYFRETFIPFWDERFTVAPRSSHNAHRPLGSFRLDSVLCRRFERKVATDYTLRLSGQRWLIPRAHVRRPACVTPASSSSNGSTARPGYATAGGTCPSSPCRRRPQVLPGYALQALRPNPSCPPNPGIPRATTPGVRPAASTCSSGHFYLAPRRTFPLCVDTPPLAPRPWLQGPPLDGEGRLPRLDPGNGDP